MKIDFKEGRGFEFTTAVEEVKTRHDNDRGQRQAEAETLRRFRCFVLSQAPNLIAVTFCSNIQPANSSRRPS